MKKGLIGISLIAAFALMACEKDTGTDNIEDEILNEEETLRLPESGFTITETTPLGDEVDGVFTSGVIEYEKDGELLAKFDFSESDEEHGVLEMEGEKKDCDLKKHGKKHPFKKVIVKPIVKTDDCEHPVAGIIKFFSKKTGDWLATIDFGDGTCDDIAVKTTAKGDYEFTLGEKH